MSSRLRVFVEGDTDEPFARRVIEVAGHSTAAVFVVGGHGMIDKRVERWCKPSNVHPMLVLRDLKPTLGKNCAPALVRHLVGDGPHSVTTVFRLAERELEAWLLADRAAVAEYFSVKLSAVPLLPDTEFDPKQTLVNICRSSSSSRIRNGMVPTPSSGRAVGQQFTGLVLSFGRSHWDAARARTASPSLDRAIAALELLP